jgi:hypothetical protein
LDTRTRQQKAIEVGALLSRLANPPAGKEVTRMPQQPNGHAAHQAELEERLEKYLRGDLRALDGFDEPEVMQRAYESQVDPDDFNTQDGFVHACVHDLMAHGELNRGEANAKCHTIWAEHSNHAVGPKLPPALNDGQKRVRAELERQRPILDPVTQKLWDDWFKRNFDALMSRHIDAINKLAKNLTKEINRSIDAHNALVEELAKDRIDSVDAHNANVKAIKALREDVHKETTDWAKRMDKQFTAEISTLRDTMIFHTSENLNIMFADVKKVSDIRFAEQIVKAREELRNEFAKETADLVKAKEEFSGEVAVLREKVSLLSDDLGAALSDVTNSLRTELATEFIKASEEMREELRKELRQEMRHELSAKIKMMRNAFRKNRKV